MEPEGSLRHSEVPAACPYPGPDQSVPFPHIPLNIIRPSMPGSYESSLPRRFPHQNPVYTSPRPIRATCPASLILLYLVLRKIFCEQYRSLSSSLCSFLHSPVTSSLLGPNILHCTLFSNALSLRFSLNVSDQVSHPYKRPAILWFCIS